MTYFRIVISVEVGIGCSILRQGQNSPNLVDKVGT